MLDPDALREAPTPLTVQHLTEVAMWSKGLDAADVALRVRFTEQTRVTLNRLEGRGRLQDQRAPGGVVATAGAGAVVGAAASRVAKILDATL